MGSRLLSSKISYSQVILISFGILGFQLVSSLPEVFGVESRVVSVPYRAFYLSVCCLVILKFKWESKTNLFFIPVLLYIFFYFIRSIYDSFILYDIVKDVLVDYWLFTYLVGFFPMISFNYNANAPTLRSAKFFVFLLALIVNLAGFVNNITIYNEGNFSGRFQGNEVLNQISYGQTGVIMIIMCLVNLINRNVIHKLLLFAILFLGLTNVALAGSRGPMIQLIFVLIVFISNNFHKIGALNVAVAFLIIICLGFYFSDYLIIFNTVLDRLQETNLDQNSGNEERNFLFKEAWQQFINNPILGYKAIGIYPHNLILESFMALGFFGGLLMIYITVIALRNSFYLIKNESTNWVALILLMYTIGTFTSGTIWNSFEFWSLLAFSFALYRKFIYLNNIIQ